MYIFRNDCWPPSISRTRTQRPIRTNFQNFRFDKDLAFGDIIIQKCLGTPNNRNWPTILNDITPESKSFLEMKPKLKNYSGEDWTVKAPRLDIYGRDLLSSLLRYHNSARISARCAMKHHVFEVGYIPYFNISVC